jgi:C_GCAxxG_C_C family probable redox protein
MPSDNDFKISKSLDYFEKGYKCSQSVFSAFATENGLSEETALKISKFLGSGFLYRGEICGAVSGALMVYSLKFGSSVLNNDLADEIFYKLCSDHIKSFENKFGTVMCKELVGCNMGIPEELEIAKESGVFDKRCPAFVEYSSKLLSEALDYIEEKKKKYSNIMFE